MNDTGEDYKEPPTISTYITDTLLAPIHLILSPILLRTYLRTALILLTSTILFGLAVIAYSTLYYAYIPIRGISVPVHLQFDHSNTLSSLGTVLRYPHGIANVDGLVSRQKYDVVVEMVLPRSRKNMDAGNWMMGIEMRGPATAGGRVKDMLGWHEEWNLDDLSQGGEVVEEKETVSTPNPTKSNTMSAESGSVEKRLVLARSRRPTILTYRSWMTEFAHRALRLPLYVVGWGEESETVKVTMMEGLEFDKGWKNIPSTIKLEVRSKTPLDVYKATVKFVARLEGLRWIMYHYRLSSLVVFTSLFWAVEMTVVLLTWAVFSIFLGGAQPMDEGEEKKRIKMEDGGAITPKTELGTSAPPTPLSDTSRTFPTLSSQQPLYYPSSASEASKLKEERVTPGLEDIPMKTEIEADDEDEDEDADFILEEPVPNSAAGVLTDSGIGTSMESGRDGDKGLVRRRSGKRER